MRLARSRRAGQSFCLLVSIPTTRNKSNRMKLEHQGVRPSHRVVHHYTVRRHNRPLLRTFPSGILYKLGDGIQIAQVRRPALCISKSC